MADTKEKKLSTDSPSSGPEHVEKQGDNYGEDPDLVPRDRLNALFQNPLGGKSKEQLFSDVEEFCNKWDLQNDIDVFKRGALVAQSPHSVENIDELTEDDRYHLAREHTHKWHQPATLYYLVIMCSICAAVQGMDETANNGAQKFFLEVYNSAPKQSISMIKLPLLTPFTALQYHYSAFLPIDG